MHLKLDLHPIYNDSKKLDAALNDIIQEAVECKASYVEIIPGKGSGQLKKKVLRFLQQPHIKNLYHRVVKRQQEFRQDLRAFPLLSYRSSRNISAPPNFRGLCLLILTFA